MCLTNSLLMPYKIGRTNTVLCELYHSLVTKEELSNTAKLSVLESVFVLILIYDSLVLILVRS